MMRRIDQEKDEPNLNNYKHRQGCFISEINCSELIGELRVAGKLSPEIDLKLS